MKMPIDRWAALAAATVLLTGCPKAEEPPAEPTTRLQDPVYVQKLDVERDEQKRIQNDLEAVRQALEALTTEDPELAGERAKELAARRDALLEEFGESRQRASATVRARILQDLNNEKQKGE